MRILIADPDVESHRALRELLAVIANADVIVACDDGRKIVSAWERHAAELVFLDMDLPQLSEFCEEYAGLDNKPAHLIGLAADEAAAMRALEKGAADFILKPVTAEGVKRVFITLRYLSSRGQPVRLARHDGGLHVTDFDRMLHSAVEHIFGGRRRHESGKLAVKVGTHIRLLKPMNITHVRAAGDYVDIVMATGEHIHTKHPLTSLMSRLPVQQFVRTHRSFILNKEYVKEIRTKNNDYELVLTDDTIVTSGSTYRKDVRRQFLLNAM